MGLEHLFQRTPALEGACPEAISRLISSASIRIRKRGDLLWRAGDAPVGFTVVKAGLIKLVREGAGGRRVTCGIFGPPESIGELVLLKNLPYPADAVVATQEAAIVTVPRSVLLSCIESYPTIGVSIACGMQSKLKALQGSIDVLGAGSVESRLATALLKLYEQFGDDFEDGTSRIPVALARKDLADLISTSVETVIRVMTRWEREGVVTTDDDGFTLKNRQALAIAAGQDTDPAASGPSFRRRLI